MRRALIVCQYFPPRFSIGGKRAHRFAKYLPRHGWDSVVLTARAPDGERVDPSFSDEALPHCCVHRDLLSAAQVAKRGRRRMGTDGTLEAPTEWKPMGSSAWARARHELRYMPVIGPDQWEIPGLVRRIADLAERTRPAVLVVSGAPWEVVVAGTVAAARRRLPLVLEFRDPWSFGFLADRRPSWTRACMRWIERAVLRRADALVVNTEAARDRYSRMGNCRRVVAIRSGFEPDLRRPAERDDAVTFIHFGNSYGERTLAPFLRAFAISRARVPAATPMRLLNLGRVARRDLELARELGIASCFRHRPVVPYTEGIGIIAGADLALLESFGADSGILPGKLYDYLLARAPILAVDASAELRLILQSTGLGWAHSADDIDGLARRMSDAVDARSSGASLVHADERALASFSAEASAGKLAATLDEVSGNSAR